MCGSQLIRAAAALLFITFVHVDSKLGEWAECAKIVFPLLSNVFCLFSFIAHLTLTQLD